jgi:hypothetical protein
MRNTFIGEVWIIPARRDIRLRERRVTMIKRKFFLNVAIIFSVVLIQLSSAYRTLADDGSPPEGTPAATQTEDLSSTPTPAATPEATPTEELTPTATEAATPDPEAMATPAATDAATLDTEATPTPTDTVVPDPEATPAPTDAVTPDPACATTGDAAGGADAACAEPPTVTIPYSDPIWCPEGSVPGDTACTPPQASITALINYLNAYPTTYTGNGAIYLMTGAYTGSETYISINYTILPQLGTLSVLGGWDLGGTNTNNGITTFTVPLEVVWNSDVTLEDLAVSLPAGSTDAGLFVSTSGNITLDNVTVQGGFSGAELSNYGGTGNVTVTNSDFSNNTNTGLLIYSSGPASLANVVASNNNNGIYIDNTTGTGDVTLNNIFTDGNGWTGVDVRSAGNINLDGLTANNGTVGANLDATAGNGNIFVSNSTFNADGSIGIKAVAAAGDVTLTNVQTDSQNAPGSIGAWLKSYGGGTIFVTGSVFANADTGLFVVGTGDVTLTNVTAAGNAGDGATIESGWVFGCFGPDGIAVTVDGGTYQDNGGYGFAVYPGPNGSATLAGTIAFLNNSSGDYNIDLTRSCNPGTEEKPAKPYQVVEVSGKGDDPAQPDCDLYAGLMLILPDQTRVKVSCPIDVEITVAAVEKDKLPGDAPKSVEVVSGLEVTAGDSNMLPEGSSMQVCFAIPEGMEGKHFAILYWDPTANDGVGGWIELPVNQFGGQVFALHPDTPEDGMRILEGVYQSSSCVCARVNFTGTFILVAR